MSDVREQLADYAHAAWSGWMDYLFSKCEPGVGGDEFADGSLVIPAWAVERWKRQAATPYTELPESEKESDRDEADKMLAITRAVQCTICGAAHDGAFPHKPEGHWGSRGT